MTVDGFRWVRGTRNRRGRYRPKDEKAVKAAMRGGPGLVLDDSQTDGSLEAHRGTGPRGFPHDLTPVAYRPAGAEWGDLRGYALGQWYEAKPLRPVGRQGGRPGVWVPRYLQPGEDAYAVAAAVA